jgi:tetratricopeptide (TPR) repeat protein
MRRTSAETAGAIALVVALLAGPPPVHAQALGQGFELERQGQLARAAEVYAATARANATYLPALLGLERVLPQLQRLPELLPMVRVAVAADPANPAFRGLELRVLAGLSAFDSLDAAARSWAQRSPGDETPYREWARALEGQRLGPEARRVLLLGRDRLGRPDALSSELAGLSARSGDWENAAGEWVSFAAGHPAQLPMASSALATAPVAVRERVLARLGRAGAAPPGPHASAARRLAAEVLIAWGDPRRAWDLFATTLPESMNEAAQALRRFADRAGSIGGQDGALARGLALERMAGLVQTDQAAPFYLDAARAFVSAGDHVAARRVLDQVAKTGGSSPTMAAAAEATIIAVMLEEGAVDDAVERFRARRDDLLGDDVSHLSELLAWALVRRGDLAGADALFAADSSVEGLALRGWIALYRGDLRTATAQFLAAGPYAGRRDAVTDRTQLLALMQQIGVDSLPELGQALLTLKRGDSTAALAALRSAAQRLTLDGGRLDVLLVAGKLARARGDWRTAEEILAGLIREPVAGGRETAAPPAAELELAQMLVEQGRRDEAIVHLEHLILTYPTSAVVPQARRELERAKGAIPRS